ncbi:MAG TPA: hypothetical protein VGF94_16715 [Kofleriaceae bacterium]|jgi:hypothetical protein
MPSFARICVVVACLVGSSGIAAADDYPIAVVDRPLTLPGGMLQAYAAGTLGYDSPTSTTLEGLELGGDYGIAPKLQAGAFVDLLVSPSSQLDRAFGTVQYQLLAFAALRIDLGAQRVGNGDTYAAFGVGLPLRLKLTDTVALISSRPWAWGEEDDIFQARTDASSWISEVHVPAGLLWQVAPRVALVARGGYTHQGSAGFVPLGVDAVLAVDRLDVGITFDVAGQIAPSNGTGYFDDVRGRLFLQLRL